MRAKGRGSQEQPVNRFTQHEFQVDPEYLEYLRLSGEDTRVGTEMLDDRSKSVLTHNDSPDIDFEYTLNPYRGCEHGCSYCYARPTHEYLGFSAGLDFETKIVVKREAPQLLREQLSKKNWIPTYLALSGVTDCYQPMEKDLALTRACLRVLADFRQPVEIITKNYLVTRDIDLLQELARFRAVRVRVSITTLDPALSNKMEPRASTPARRLEAISRLSQAGIPVGVNASPMIPGLNDHEMPEILLQAAQAGADWGDYLPVRLPGAVAPVFTAWLREHFPDKESKVLRLIRELRGGLLNQAEFHQRFHGQGEVARRLRQLYNLGLKRAKLSGRAPELLATGFEVPGNKQLGLFDDL